MANCSCRGRCARQTNQMEQASTVQSNVVQTVEDMPMNRYVNTIPLRQDVGGCNCELRQLNEILDYQNRILVEILAALDNLAGKLST